ncbi:MAG: chromosome segregation protein SMC [Thermoanaerobaculia bacterium]
MLKLARLELSGFKSFVDPTTLDFAGGVTGVVGPNGCGKSNLSDAITWVLGEQSAKTLRGETMEDVIFNGSEKRGPLGMAEVELHFLGEPGFAGVEDGRISIARRVFRSGESQYRMNGKLVRLKEIKDLLMDTGLGVRAYSVIEQGKIGLILSGKPQERRRLIEEAAGITRYKARKKIAEVKLEEACANLLRLDDIVSEVERNLRSLKRQAGTARRYQERAAELRELHRAVLAGRWAALAGRLAGERSRLGEAHGREAELAAAIHRAEAALAERRSTLDAALARHAAAHREQAAIAARIEGRQQYLVGARRTLSEIASRLAAGQESAARREQETAALEHQRAELVGARDQVMAAHGVAAERVAADAAALAAAEAATAEAEQRLETVRRELLASIAEIQALRGELHRGEIETEKGAMRQRHLDEELAESSGELKESNRALATAQARLGELASARQVAESGLATARAELDRILGEEATASERARALEREWTGAGERRRLLAELAAADVERRAELGRRLAELGLAAPQFLGDRLTAPRGWEQALDRFLGEWTDAVVLPAGEDAPALATRLAAAGVTTGTLLAPLAVERETPAAAIFDPAIQSELGGALGLPAEIARALPPAYLVERTVDAQRLARRHPGVAFVARDGVWAQSGLLHLAAPEAQPGVLARQSELADLEQRVPALGLELERWNRSLTELVAARAIAAEAIRRAQDEASELRQEEAVTRSRRDELATRQGRLAQQSATLRSERDDVARHLERVTASHGETTSRLAALESDHPERETRFDRAQTEVDRARAERETLRALEAGRKGELEVLAERLRAFERDRIRIEREVEAGRRAILAWREEQEGLVARRVELESGQREAETDLQMALELAAGGEEALRAEQESLETERQAVRDDEESLAAVRAEHDGARSRVEEARVALTGLEHDATHLDGEFREHFSEPLPAAPGEVPAELAAMEERLLALRASLEAIGPVNVLAAEEYAEQEERHKFLTAQRADVAGSVESLRATIREINLTSSARFREAFAAVNEQFAKTFVELFRGGEAEMRLMDEDDPLESGIEIVARPPGKRLQNLMLLSGGEKALTAIALLFALFRTKPSPFCILDEVDAPLDDVNTLRFVGMLRQLSRETQCIVITHNKLTMEVAGSLYGVTMEERGVSKLIQVALEELQPVEAATAGG